MPCGNGAQSKRIYRHTYFSCTDKPIEKSIWILYKIEISAYLHQYAQDITQPYF